MTPERWQQVKGVLHGVLELAPSERAVFLDRACNGDQALRQEVDSLLASEDELAAEKKLGLEFLDEPAVAFPAAASGQNEEGLWVGRRVGPYKILELAGMGGMGEVYRAIRDDDQYQKQVALKVVRAGQDSGFVVNRFKNERRILANLDHPNIARLLDGGTSEDGAPYFVMEFIEGQPVDQYCNQHKLAVRDRLKLFLQVCSAVQFAHQRLIIHRDIKPGNILVTSEGVPKLLDFGIAKLLDVNPEAGKSEATATLFRVLTPAYASPEQVRGEPIMTASDVYSLGVVLYELLTGASPYPVTSHAPQEMVRAVCEVEPERPSTALRRTTTNGKPGSTHAPVNVAGDVSRAKLAKRLSGDLDNIVLMALRKEPQRRYASAEQFAEDIRRHLEDLPVIARKDTIRYRTTKFVSRHKTGVVAALGIVLTLSGALAVTLREARVAQRRFDDVRSLANSLIFDIHDSIQDIPGSTQARELIVEKSLHYLDSLARESAGDTALQRELAVAYQRVGEVQGYPYHPNLGDTDGALKSYQKALAIRQAVFASRQRNTLDAVALAECFRSVAEILLVHGETNTALENIQHSVQISEQADQTNHDKAKVVEELTRDYEAEANILGGDFNLSNLGDNSAALRLRGKQLETAERRVKLEPDSPSAQRSLAGSLAMMGDQLLFEGERRQALQYQLRTHEIVKDLAAHSESAKLLEDLEGIDERIFVIQLADGNAKAAEAAAREGVNISERLVRTDPHDAHAKLGLAISYVNLAEVTSMSPSSTEAWSAATKATALMDQLLRQDPRNTDYLGEQASIDVNVGDALKRLGDYRRALRSYRDAASILSQLPSEGAQNSNTPFFLAVCYNRIASVYISQRDAKQALAMHQKALSLAEPGATSSNPNIEALYSTAEAYTGLGDTENVLAAGSGESWQAEVQHWKQAASWYEHSLKLWARIKEPGDLSPNGFECTPPTLVARRLAKVKRAQHRVSADLTPSHAKNGNRAEWQNTNSPSIFP